MNIHVMNPGDIRQPDFFSPTSRYGTADQLKAFVDACHKHKIGVLMDFVPVHFAVDAYASVQITMELPFMNIQTHAVGVSEWGSCNFMHSQRRNKKLPCSPVPTTG